MSFLASKLLLYMSFIFGYGIFVFVMLYLIYILYHFMLELKSPNVVPQSNGDEENNLMS